MTGGLEPHAASTVVSWEGRLTDRGLFDQIWRRICLGNAVKASRSGRAASRCSVVLGNLSASASMIRKYWAAADPASGWSNTECNSVRTHVHDDFGLTAIRFVVYCVLQRCQAAPGQCRADRGHRAGVRVAGDQRYPGQAASRQGPPERQPARPVFGGGDVDAQDLAAPSALTPTAIRACTLTTRPPSRTLSTRASAATNVYNHSAATRRYR